MRVLIVNCVFDPEPVVSAQIGKSISENLVALSHIVTVISPYPSRPFGFQFNYKNNFPKKIVKIVDTQNLKVVNLPSFVYPKSNIIGRLFESISFGWYSYKYIINNSSDLDRVYMNTWPLFGQLGVAIACKMSNIKYIVHVQDLYPESIVNKLSWPLDSIFLNLLMPIEKYVIRNAFKIVVVSKNMKDNIMSRGKIYDGKIKVVFNWQDESVFNDIHLSKFDTEILTFMYLGNIGPVSNIPFLIQSFFEADIRAKLIIAGSGSKRKESEDLVSSLGAKNIQFLEN
jgi:glycosyltransferase involved in cell wall biosynthesis